MQNQNGMVNITLYIISYFFSSAQERIDLYWKLNPKPKPSGTYTMTGPLVESSVSITR